MNEIFAWVMGMLAVIIPGFGEVLPPQYHGYVEADYVYMAPASVGRIEKMAVEEGALVEKGQLLFVLESRQQMAGLRAAEAREAVADATWRNMETGSRVEEVAVIRASLSKAESDRSLAELTLQRSVKLNAQGFASVARVDADRATLANAMSQVAQFQAQLEVAELPARDDQLVAAEATLEAARADVDRAQSQLADTTIVAPASGLIERVYFRVGEVASSGSPVVALLPPGELKARFFIPEPDRAKFALGDVLTLSCDSCEEGMTAKLSRMSSQPQHTPPIIFSRDERKRLVFMAEAQLQGDTRLLPGQPITLMVQQ